MRINHSGASHLWLSRTSIISYFIIVFVINKCGSRHSVILFIQCLVNIVFHINVLEVIYKLQQIV